MNSPSGTDQAPRPNFDDWISQKTNARVYHPTVLVGAIHEPVATQPRVGRAYESGRRVLVPETGEQLFVPTGHPSKPPSFIFKAPDSSDELVDGNYATKYLWDRPLVVFIINRIGRNYDPRPLSRSEYDASRLAQFFRAQNEIPVTTGAFPDNTPEHIRRQTETIVVDLRAELPTDPPHEGWFERNTAWG